MSESEPRLLMCAKLGEELPAIGYRPFKNELGERIYSTISQDAWSQWIEYSKMIVNEYRLDLTSVKAHDILLEQCENFLFGDDATAPPPDFVAPGSDPEDK